MIQTTTHQLIAHCRGHFYREFAWKTLEGEDRTNHSGVLLDLVRARTDPLRNAAHLIAQTMHYRDRPGKYVSVYSFSGLVKNGDTKSNGEPYPEYMIGKAIRYESAKLDRIYLDFDNADDPQNAIDEALIVMRSLNKHKIFCHCYFSGSKGIALYIEFITVDIKPENKKAVLKLFLEMMIQAVKDDFGYNVCCIDLKVSFDLARVSRLPNTKHKSGLYCIPITVSDMRKGLMHIKAIAANPSHTNLDRIITTCMMRNLKMPRIMLNLEKEVIAKRAYDADEKKKKELYYSQIKPRLQCQGAVTDEQIGRARRTPLSRIIGHETNIRCPIHQPGPGHNQRSFYIDHTKNVWYCHSCGFGGSPIDYMMKKENLSFKGAVLALQ